MIHHFDYPAPLSPPEQTLNDQITAMSYKVSVAYLDHVCMKFAEAMVKANGGIAPTPEEMAAKAQTFVGACGTHYLLWGAPVYEPGEKVDMSYVIATVPPPKVFKCEQPKTLDP